MAKPKTWRDLPIVEIEWVDASLDGSGTLDLENPATIKSFGGLKVCRDIGYLVYKDKRVVKLALSLCPEDSDCRHANTIPRGWVKRIIVLTRPEEEHGEEASV